MDYQIKKMITEDPVLMNGEVRGDGQVNNKARGPETPDSSEIFYISYGLVSDNRGLVIEMKSRLICIGIDNKTQTGEENNSQAAKRNPVIAHGFYYNK